jgi:hypothetical protein
MMPVDNFWRPRSLFHAEDAGGAEVAVKGFLLNGKTEKRKTENEKRKTKNGKRKTEHGEWTARNECRGVARHRDLRPPGVRCVKPPGAWRVKPPGAAREPLAPGA